MALEFFVFAFYMAQLNTHVFYQALGKHKKQVDNSLSINQAPIG